MGSSRWFGSSKDTLGRDGLLGAKLRARFISCRSIEAALPGCVRTHEHVPMILRGTTSGEYTEFLYSSLSASASASLPNNAKAKTHQKNIRLSEGVSDMGYISFRNEAGLCFVLFPVVDKPSIPRETALWTANS